VKNASQHIRFSRSELDNRYSEVVNQDEICRNRRASNFRYFLAIWSFRIWLYFARNSTGVVLGGLVAAGTALLGEL
jgi:hypothetical protein